MGMLDRIKKRQWEGLKDFVESVEITTAAQRQTILLNGVLEDPLFMRWVMKNIKGFPDFLSLSSDQIEDILRTNESLPRVLAKALPASDPAELQQYAVLCPRIFPKLKDEFSLLSQVPPGERESAQFFLLKTVRKMQREQRIEGFRWQLPSQEVFYDKPSVKEGKLQITFEDGTIAAEGEMHKGKRIGKWRHFYDNGRLLGEGSYQEGSKTGNWVFLYASGERRSEGHFFNDVRHGPWVEWDRTGEKREIEWKEGKKVEK